VPTEAELRRLSTDTQGMLFSNEALKEAAALRPQAHLAKREEAKGVVLSIDGGTTRDLDNAISIRMQRDGTLVVGIHAVDMATVVRLGGALDYSARQRVQTQYMQHKGLTLFMIPKSLAEGILSLFEGKTRLTKSVEMTFSPHGVLTGHRIFNSKLVNRYQLTNETAAEALQGSGRGAKSPEVTRALKALTLLAGKANAQGATNARPASLQTMVSFFTERSARLVGEALSKAQLESSFRNQLSKDAKSVYENVSKGHASLQAPAYTTWTGGMRRYADIEVQRGMERLITAQKPATPKALRERAMRDLQHGRANGDGQADRRDGVRELIGITRPR
jgi:exoribonuclease R